MVKTISQNTTYLTLASVLQKVLAFIYFTVLANMIGVEGTGKYFFALSFTTIFVVFIDLGFTNVFIREAAKAKDQIEAYLSTLLVCKLVMSVLTYAAAMITISLLNRPLDVQLLVAVSGITMIFDSLHLTLYGALRALGDLRYEGIGMVLSQGLTLVLGSLFLWLGAPLVWLIVAFTIPSFLNVVFVSYILRTQYHIRYRLKFHKTLFISLGTIAIPFAIAAVLSRLYSYVDTMLLAQLLGDAAVGIYSVPYKITFAFQFIPMALIAALYPRMSALFVTDIKRLGYVFEQSMVYLLVIAVPIAVGIGVLAEPIISLLYTDAYAGSVVPLQILISSLMWSFVSFPIGALLNACDRQVSQTVIVAIALVCNIVLNFTLIPILGVTGAAIAALVGNIILTVGGYIVARHILSLPHARLLYAVLRILVAGGVMGIVVGFTVAHSHVFVAIAIGAIVYPLLLASMRVVTLAHLRELRTLIRS